MTVTPDDEQEDAEATAWRNVDPTDPEAVARALAALGMRAGAKMATLEHMHDRIGRALERFDDATAALNALVPRAEMERQLAQLRHDVDEDRQHDRATSLRRFVGVIVAGLLFATVIVSAVVLNRAAIARSDEERENFERRSEAVAICASTYPGDEARIRGCVAEKGVPSAP